MFYIDPELDNLQTGWGKKGKGLYFDMKNEIKKNWEIGQQKTFVFVYYAGHGFMDNGTTAILLNSDNPKKVHWNMELLLRTLGTQEGAYVVGLFDCCREIFDFVEAVKQAQESGIGGLTRGTGNDE